MRISEKKKTALYEAISEPIMKKRITIKHSEPIFGVKNTSDIDDLLYRLQHQIWVEVKKALDIKD